jgi:hypothetical protein
MPVRLDLHVTTRNGRGEMMIRLPAVDGHEVELYEPLDAQAYLGGISANTLSRWRREGWLRPAVAIGRGYMYLKADLDQCRTLRNLNSRNREVNYA